MQAAVTNSSDPDTTMNVVYLKLAFACIFFSLVIAGCAHKDTLHEYEVHGTTLSVDAPLAPLPDVILAQNTELDDPTNTPLGNLILAAPKIINSTRAEISQQRLDQAAEHVDVALLVANGILDRSEIELGMLPIDQIADSDFTMTVDINRHGVTTARGLTFFLHAHVALFDNATDDRIWVRKVEISKQISEQGLFRNLKATQELNDMTEEELIEMLAMISDFSADGIVSVLKESL